MNDAHYVRPAGLPGAADIKTYDVGNFFIASQGILNNVAVGELHVRYRCRLSIPILGGTVLAAPTNNSVSVFQSTGTEAITSTVAAVLALATATTNGLTVVNTAGSLVLPVGNYLVDANIQVNAATALNVVSISLLKNAVAFASSAFAIPLVAACTATTLPTDSVFYQSNGTDALTLSITSTFTGAGTATGYLRIVAV